MGYYTDYELKLTADFDIISKYPQLEFLPAVLEKYTGYVFETTGLHSACLSGAKWYDHHIDMVNMSKDFPEILFQLNGEGEESGDTWRSFYKNGKATKLIPIITWPEFDERQLK